MAGAAKPLEPASDEVVYARKLRRHDAMGGATYDEVGGDHFHRWCFSYVRDYRLAEKPLTA